MSIGAGCITAWTPNRMNGGNRAWPRARVLLTPLPNVRQRIRSIGPSNKLDDDAREIVHLHYYQGLSIQETADALGIATSTVKYRLRHAIANLQTRLAEPRLHA